VINFYNLTKIFKLGGGFLSGEAKLLYALRNVSFEVEKGATLGIVGESGSGKSTLARVFIGLYKPDEGHFQYEDFKSGEMTDEKWKLFRQKVSMVFQDPYSSLNPRMKIKSILQEPFLIHKKYFPASKEERLKKIYKILDMVGLDKGSLDKYPHEFSGGQRQRIGIARALILTPEVIVLDEPVSALDVSIQAQILNLLKEIKKEMNLTYLFIAHDLSVIEYMSDKIVVMYLGSVLEEGPASELLKKPRHHYTRTLIDSMPDITKQKKDFKVIKGEIPSPINLPPGCVFASRCPAVKEKCRNEMPEKTKTKKGFFHCHYPLK